MLQESKGLRTTLLLFRETSKDLLNGISALGVFCSLSWRHFLEKYYESIRVLQLSNNHYRGDKPDTLPPKLAIKCTVAAGIPQSAVGCRCFHTEGRVSLS